MSQEQRALLADKLCDAANLAAGALVLSQFVSGVPFSTRLAALGVLIWVVVMAAAVTLMRRGGSPMMTGLAIYAGMAVVAWIIVLLDAIDRRRIAESPRGTHDHCCNRPTSS